MKINKKLAAALALTLPFAGVFATSPTSAAPSASKEAPKAAAPAGRYDQGVTADTILLGRTTALTGILSQSAAASEAGLRAVWDEKNSQGGVWKRKILQESIDDGYDVERTKAAAAKLTDHVFAMVFTNGTANTNAILSIVTAAKVPLIGSSSGSVMRKKEQTTRYFFNTRDDNFDDVKAITHYLKEIRDTRMCSVYQDDNYGKTMQALMDSAADKDGVEMVAKVPMAPRAQDAKSVIAALSNAGCDHVGNIGMLMLDKPTGVFLRDFKSQGGKAADPRAAALGMKQAAQAQRLFATTSSSEFQVTAGVDGAANVIVAQSTPPMTSFATPALIDFRRLMLSKPETAKYVSSVLAFQGYLTAKVFIAALTDAGPNPTREGLIEALEKFKARDMGGLYFDYSTPPHEGMHYTELFMWSPTGSMFY